MNMREVTSRFLTLGFLLSIAVARGILCRDNGHTEGAWVKLTNPTEAVTFQCPNGSDFHSTNKQDYLFHNGSRNSDWSGGCLCPLHRAAFWRWKPAKCDLLAWNASRFCEVLGDRIVLLSGDSTMNQAAVTLMQLIKEHGGQCHNQLYYGSSHFLIFQNQADFTWHNWIIKHKEKILPDIVVLTVGAHAQDIGDMYMIWENLIKDIRMVRERFFWHNFTFVWKTQQPGHAACFNYSQPLFTPNNRFRWGTHFDEELYNWYLHPSFDAFSVNQSLLHNIKILDLSPLYERPDAHPGSVLAEPNSTKDDCLHYCIPGPIDLFASLFFQMLDAREI